MADRYVFADEAGNFDFSRGPSATRYFVLCTVTMDDCSAGDRLLALRRTLGWRGLALDSVFHATEDAQAVRDEVYAQLRQEHFRVDATIFEKSKAQPHLRTPRDLYKMAWYLHFKYVAPQIANRQDRLMVVAASLGTKRTRGAFINAIDDVVQQVSPCASHRTAFWPMNSDPCLQIADYATWAIQRWWERNDDRSLDLIRDKVYSQYNVWSVGTQHYY